MRELLISIYLFLSGCIFRLFRLLPLQRKTIFLTCFGDPVIRVVHEVHQQTKDALIIIKLKPCDLPTDMYSYAKIIQRPALPFQWLRLLFHLATARAVWIDNYVPLLATCRLKSQVPCIQLWHAVGAIKRFGWKDPAIQKRSTRALERFRTVYSRFTHVVVGSDYMAAIFQQGFGIPPERIFPTGIPRTDFFFDVEEQRNIRNEMMQCLPHLQQKVLILYAPTFHQQEMSLSSLQLDLELMYDNLHHTHMLILHLHPRVADHFHNPYPDFVLDLSGQYPIQHLMSIADLLITDYSSIAFEYALLDRPMYFFAYDLNSYEDERGFWQTYEALVPGPVSKHTAELITHITSQTEDPSKRKDFATAWNQYSDGHSSQRVVQLIYHNK